jgi:hypothetical protein
MRAKTLGSGESITNHMHVVDGDANESIATEAAKVVAAPAAEQVATPTGDEANTTHAIS